MAGGGRDLAPVTRSPGAGATAPATGPSDRAATTSRQRPPRRDRRPLVLTFCQSRPPPVSAAGGPCTPLAASMALGVWFLARRPVWPFYPPLPAMPWGCPTRPHHRWRVCRLPPLIYRHISHRNGLFGRSSSGKIWRAGPSGPKSKTPPRCTGEGFQSSATGSPPCRLPQFYVMGSQCPYPPKPYPAVVNAGRLLAGRRVLLVATSLSSDPSMNAS